MHLKYRKRTSKNGVFANKYPKEVKLFAKKEPLRLGFYYICMFYNKVTAMDKNINRIKVALAEKKKTNKWLAEQLDVAQTTVSKWCTNTTQPPIETFMKIAELLEVDLNDLVRFEKNK